MRHDDNRPIGPEEYAWKVRAALAALQDAQACAAAACRELCPLNGYAPAFDRISKLHDQIKKEWHRLERFRPERTS